MSWWTSESSFTVLSWSMIVTGAGAGFALLSGLKAFYGRYSIASWTAIPARAAWMIQESPSFFLPLLALPSAPWQGRLVLLFFLIHYTNRTFIYPCQLKNPKPTAIVLVASAFAFCLWNGYIQGFYHAWYFHPSADHFSSPITVIGVILFFTGMAINLHSDHILRNLRKEGETEYKIPRGGMFDYVSGANFFGEIVEWFGYALIARTLPSFSFFFFTIANIGPRAIHHHQWYKEKFDDYPKDRKALIPFVL